MLWAKLFQSALQKNPASSMSFRIIDLGDLTLNFNKRFGEVPAVMEKVVLREPGGATAEVRLHGGHMSSWKNKEGEELLYVSPSRAVFQGIQVYFPEFRGSAPPELLHGFRSSRNWQIDPNPPGIPRPTSASSVPNEHFVNLIWTSVVTMPDGRPSEDDKENAGQYTLRQRIRLGSSGELTSDFWVTNVSIEPFKFKFSLLNHLPDSDINEVRLEGLQMLHYNDHLKREDEMLTENEGSITFDSEVERVYLETPTIISITNYDKQKTYVLKRKNLPDVVVWNHRDGYRSILAGLLSVLSCFGAATNDREDEYKHVLSVGGAVNDEIELRPKQVWHARQQISIVPTHHYMGQVDPIRS